MWRWQARFMAEGADGLLHEATRPAGKPPLSAQMIARVVAMTLAEPPGEAMHWTCRAMARAAGVSHCSVQRIWAARVNRFFSSVVRIQRERGHSLVTAGPYRWVRHPGYAGAIPATLASGIALCSWLTTSIGLLGVLLLLWRTIGEDRTCEPNCRATKPTPSGCAGDCCRAFGKRAQSASDCVLTLAWRN
ncbi:MAG: helix-turn-helix domain-containing protein [Stellaceae bacterium]